MRNYTKKKKILKGGEANWRECFNLIYNPFMEKSSNLLDILKRGQKQLGDLTKTKKIEDNLTKLTEDINSLPKSVSGSNRNTLKSIKSTLKNTIKDIENMKKSRTETIEEIKNSVVEEAKNTKAEEEEIKEVISIGDLKTLSIGSKTRSQQAGRKRRKRTKRRRKRR